MKESSIKRLALAAGVIGSLSILTPLGAAADEYYYQSTTTTPVIEQPAPVETVIERTTPVVVDRPVVVEKTVDRPVVVEKHHHHLLHLGIPLLNFNLL